MSICIKLCKPVSKCTRSVNLILLYHAVNRAGTASSWSLSRLDSLAEEVKSCFMQQNSSFLIPHQQHTDGAPCPADNATDEDRKTSHSTASTSSPNNIDSSPGNNSKHDENDASPSSTQDHPEAQARSSAQLAVARAMLQYPMQTVAALNTVLFERHGYSRMQRHGNPR